MAESSHTAPIGSHSDIRPVPDPTLLTSAALAQVMEQMRRELHAVREVLEARFDAMDKATMLIRMATDRVPSDVDAKIGQLHSLYNEKFLAIRQELMDDQRWAREKFADIQTQLGHLFFAEREARSAALISAKEALLEAKSATDKRFEDVERFRSLVLEQMRELMPRSEATGLIQAQSTKLNDLNDRLNRSEGKGTGMEKSWAIGIAAIGVVGVVAGIVFALIK